MGNVMGNVMGKLLARLGLALGVALVVLVGVLLAVLPSPGEERAHSVFSAQEDGLRVLFLTLEALDLPVEAWSAAPGELRGAGTLLVLPALPAAPPALPAALADGEGAPLWRGRGLAHYRRFVAEGGTLLVLAAGTEALAFLRDTLALEGLLGLEAEALAPRKPSPQLGLGGMTPGAGRVTFEGGESFALPIGPVARFLGARADEVFARSENDEALGVRRASGEGSVALLALPLELFENGALEEQAEPALVFVRALEQLASCERMLFDEYALGGWRPPPFARLAFSRELAWLSLNVLLLCLVLGWRSAWSGPFARDPERLLPASPLARARGFGRMLARAGRFDLLARLLSEGVLQRWERRAGRRPAPSGAASSEAGPEAALATRLAAFARGDARLGARLNELFVTRAPRDEAELEALETALRALEEELFRQAEPGKTRARLGARPSPSGS